MSDTQGEEEDHEANKRALNPKLVVVGDLGVGKTCLLISYCCNSFPDDYVPDVFDDYESCFMFNGQYGTLSLRDTSPANYRLRLRADPRVTCVFIAFSFSDPDSLANVKTKWYPEVVSTTPESPPTMLVGLKSDLKTDLQTIDSLMDRHQTPVTSYEAWTVANEIHAVGYFEISAMCGKGLKEAFQEVGKIYFIQKGYIHIRRSPGTGLRGVFQRLLRKRLGSREAVLEYGNSCLENRKLQCEEEELLRIATAEEWRENHLRMNFEATEFRKSFVETGILAQDLIFHILHEFVLIDLRVDVPGFNPVLLPYRREIGLSIDPRVVHRMWFGLLEAEEGREIRQVFCHFHIPDYADVRFLPRFVRSLFLGRSPVKYWNFLTSSALAFYSRRQQYSGIRANFGSHVFRRAVRAGGAKFARIEFSSRRSPSLLPTLSSAFQDLHALTLVGRRIVPVEGVLVLPSLRTLVLLGSSNELAAMRLDFLPNLTTLKLVGRYRLFRVLTREFLSSIVEIPRLRSILFLQVEFHPFSCEPWLLISQKESLEEFSLFQCQVDFRSLERVEFPGECQLRVLVICCLGDSAEQVIPTSFVERVQERARGGSGEARKSLTLQKRRFSIFEEVCFNSMNAFKYVLSGANQHVSSFKTADQADRFVALHCPASSEL